jgi:hypothetical protein
LGVLFDAFVISGNQHFNLGLYGTRDTPDPLK